PENSSAAPAAAARSKRKPKPSRSTARSSTRATASTSGAANSTRRRPLDAPSGRLSNLNSTRDTDALDANTHQVHNVWRVERGEADARSGAVLREVGSRRDR